MAKAPCLSSPFTAFQFCGTLKPERGSVHPLAALTAGVTHSVLVGSGHLHAAGTDDELAAIKPTVEMCLGLIHRLPAAEG